jgi:hypothetical protein
MAHLAKVVVNWLGFTGAPGYTNLYFRNPTPGIITQTVADSAVARADTFLASVQSRIPPDVTLSINGTVEVIDDTNGELQGFMNVTAPASKVGSMAGVYSAPSGAVVNWYTGAVRNGRRIRGRTFLVPLGGAATATNGTIDDTHLTGLRTAANNLVAATGDSRLVVWSRPSAPGETDGVSAEVITATVPDKIAILTSRRD